MKRSMTAALCLILVGSLALFCRPVAAFAQGNIRIGKIKVTPKVAYKGELNDNIYLVPGDGPIDEESDYINTVTPGIGFSFRGEPGNYISAGYEVDLVAYTDNNDNNYEMHTVTGGFGLKSPLGLYLKADDRFIDTGDPYGTAEEYGLGMPKVERWNNTVNVSGGYEFADRFTIEAQYRNFLEEFDRSEDEWQDKKDHIYGGTLYYKFMPKTSVLVQYRRTERNYTGQEDGAVYAGDTYSSETSENYELNDYLIGLHWDPGAKISGDLKFGWVDREYDNDRDPAGNKYEDKNTWVAETRLLYRASEKTRLRAKVMRSIKESTARTYSNYYTDTAVGLGVSHVPFERFFLHLDFDYGKNEYDAYPGLKERTDDTYTAQIGVEYKIQEWLKASVDYEYKDRDSNYDQNEYTVNKATIKISGVF